MSLTERKDDTEYKNRQMLSSAERISIELQRTTPTDWHASDNSLVECYGEQKFT